MPRNRAIVGKGSTQSLTAVDLDTGDRTLLVGPGPGSSLTAIDYRDIAVDVDRNLAFLEDTNRRVLITIDLVGGERIITSF